LTVLTDEDEYLRTTALKSLVEIDPEGEKTQASLVTALGDKDEMVRGTTANLCAGLGPKAKAAVPALIAMLNDEKDENVRSLTMAALKKIDPVAARRAGVP